MSERILPGTSYVESTIGLIGQPAVGEINIALVGTACKGPTSPVFFDSSGYNSDGLSYKDVYGPVDPYSYATSTGTNPAQELTLSRSLDILYNKASGAFGGVWACRAVESGVVTSITEPLLLDATTDQPVVQFTATEAGAWYNNWQFSYQRGTLLDGSTSSNGGTFNFYKPSLDIIDTMVSTSGTRVSSNRWYTNQYNAEIKVEVVSAATNAFPTAGEVITALGASTLADYFTFALASTGTSGMVVNAQTSVTDLSTGTGGTNWSADDTVVTANTAYSDALSQLEGKTARMVLLAGASELDSGLQVIGLNHAVNMSAQNKERVFITGHDNYGSVSSAVAAATTSPYMFDNDRAFTITPGALFTNPFYGKIWGSNTATDGNATDTVSAAYVASWYARDYASRAPYKSELGKAFPYSLEFAYSDSTLKTLIESGWTPLAAGYSGNNIVRRALTSTPDGHPFHQQSTRMIIDHCKYVTRPIAQQFLGEENSTEARLALQKLISSAMDGLITDRVIIGYNVDVSATRGQQIIGVVKVKLAVQPMFYMEFIEFTIEVS